MPHTTKKQRIDNLPSAVESSNHCAVTFDDLGVDELANILCFLPVKDIMSKRRINKKWKEAVKMTIIPMTDFRVDSVEKYNAVNVMTTEMPNLQQIRIGPLGDGHKYNDGEDPHGGRAADGRITHDIGIISNFSKLRILEISNSGLNGRYPVLFNSFPLLQKLTIKCRYLKWDVGMLAGMPLLKELACWHNYGRPGNINSLRVLKETLERVKIIFFRVEGNFMDLADFPHLKELDLFDTNVTGDIRDIGVNDFSSLESLHLPKGVYGGNEYELQSISEAIDLVRALYLLKKQRPALSMLGSWRGILSEDSTDWYEPADFYDEYLQFNMNFVFVKAESRIGYQWIVNGHWCEVNWLDPEPDRDSSEYAKYIEKLRRIEMQRKVKLLKGLHQPPTEEEYNRLFEEYDDERSEGSDESDSENCWEYNASDDEW